MGKVWTDLETCFFKPIGSNLVGLKRVRRREWEEERTSLWLLTLTDEERERSLTWLQNLSSRKIDDEDWWILGSSKIFLKCSHSRRLLLLLTSTCSFLLGYFSLFFFLVSWCSLFSLLFLSLAKFFLLPDYLSVTSCFSLTGSLDERKTGMEMSETFMKRKRSERQ